MAGLTSFIAEREVAALLDRVIPGLELAEKPSLMAPPTTDHYSQVGTALDYALRIELQRRLPQAVGRRWVAEEAIALPEASTPGKTPQPRNRSKSRKRQGALSEKQRNSSPVLVEPN